MKSATITVIFLLFIAIVSDAQNYQKIDSLSQLLIDQYNLPGIAITGVKGHEVVYTGTFGKANEIGGFGDSTRIYIASNTKAFVGLAMSMLAHEGRIQYDAPITRYIDRSHFPESIEAGEITVKNLMEHTHGLSNDPLVFRTAYSGEYPSDLKELLRYTVYREDSLTNDFKYSNLGYLMAGMIIEEVTSVHWKEYIEQNILEPIGMVHSSAHIDFTGSVEALPYEYFSGVPISSRKTENVLHSAGGIYSTIPDMAKWLTLFTDPDQNRIKQAVLEYDLSKKITVGERMGPFRFDDYGNGWIHGSIMGDRLLFHFGSFYGYESMMSFKPDRNTGVFVFVNERLGGQRIAAMLSTYFYLLESDDEAADEKIQMFYQFIDPQYEKVREERPVYELPASRSLAGTYYSGKYGNLIVDRGSEGYTFSLGRLHGLAYANPDDGEDIIIEWTPGIEEHFQFVEEDGKMKLRYGDYDEFIKK